MTDPFNRLPADPDWVKKSLALGAAAAAELKCMTVLVAIQENGKLAVSIDGTPDTGDLAEIAKGGPSQILRLLAFTVSAYEYHQSKETPQ